ncbi:hypothetical protein HDU89_000741 [Geranomyces variabilis]|nr:hypothetical protein HDU89_000741 [Geranomyces variabilis]
MRDKLSDVLSDELQKLDDFNVRVCLLRTAERYGASDLLAVKKLRDHVLAALKAYPAVSSDDKEANLAQRDQLAQWRKECTEDVLAAAMIAVRNAAEAGIEHNHIAAEAALAASALKRAAPSDRDNDTEDAAATAQRAFVKRKKANDTKLPSGVTLEQLLLEQAIRTETETLAHSWTVDLGEDWVAELVPMDRGALVDLAQERAFSCGMLDRNIDVFMQSEDMYRRREAQRGQCARPLDGLRY